jgi:hypothetical protein
MDRIRVDPGYYPDRNDSRFGAEIVKYFNEVGRNDSSFKGAYDDYWSLDPLTWFFLYKQALELTSHSPL